jgi:hypothetical protein
VLVALAFTVLAACAGKWLPQPWIRISNTILFPGVAIVLYGLDVDFWRHGVAFACLVIAFNTFIYSALSGLILWLFRTLASWRKHRLSN